MEIDVNAINASRNECFVLMQRQSVWVTFLSWCWSGPGAALSLSFSDGCGCGLGVGNEKLVKVTLSDGNLARRNMAFWKCGFKSLVQLKGWLDGRIGWSCRGGIHELLLIGIGGVNFIYTYQIDYAVGRVCLVGPKVDWCCLFSFRWWCVRMESVWQL